MSSFKLNEANEEKFQKLLKRYPDKSSLSLPLLWMVKEQNGWISKDAIRYIASKLGTTPMQILSIASFYSMFNLKPIGKYHIQMCKTLSCKLCGSNKIKEHIEKRVGVKFGETTKDMKFTLSEVECLGSCGTAPVIQLNEEYIENLTVEKLDKLLDELL